MPSFFITHEPSSPHHLALSISALLLGLSRVLLPLVFLQCRLVEGCSWLAPLAHLAHHGSAILGTFIGPALLAKRLAFFCHFLLLFFSKFLVPIACSTDAANSTEKMNQLLLFLCTGLKALGFGLLALAIAFEPPVCPLILASILAIGIADGVMQRLLLVKAIQMKQTENVPMVSFRSKS